MRRLLGSLANRVLAPLGLHVVRKRSDSADWTPLESALYGLLSARGELNVIQIGANDGFWNDPIHAFLMREAQATNVLLVEPQPEIAAILAKTYVNHPSVAIFEGAVSREPGDIVLHRIRPELWEATVMPYLKDAPAYRAPSGFASSKREHVEQHAQKLRWRSNGEPVSLDEALELIHVPTRTLSGLSAMYEHVFPVDVLQVDVEGLDDQLVLSSLESEIFPRIINFEAAHLNRSQSLAIRTKLKAVGYRLLDTGSDLLAVRAVH